ncbi:MAG: hypothetical protein M3Q03_16655 [Chloroflexota bacterium]|nr:hypothetical protein [Chloroflexota bacterium]
MQRNRQGYRANVGDEPDTDLDEDLDIEVGWSIDLFDALLICLALAVLVATVVIAATN